MAPEDETRRNTGFGNDGFDGRDLLVGRPEGAEAATPAAEVSQASPPVAVTSPSISSPPSGAHPGAHQDAIAEILSTVQTIVARLDVLQEVSGPEDERAEALTRETAALTQAVGDARGALARAAELAGRQDGAAEAARVLAQGVAALRAQGEALDQRLQATGQQANQTGWQAETVAQGIKEMMPAAESLQSSLRIHAGNMSRINRDHRRRRWLTGLAIGAASFVFFATGLVLQRETDFVSFGDPRDAWNDHVEENFTPTLAACASKARLNDEPVLCSMIVDPMQEMTVPYYPDVVLTERPAQRSSELSAEQ